MECKYGVKRIILTLVSLATLLNSAIAQKLTVEGMVASPMDLSASHYERKDLTGHSCALLKVVMLDELIRVEGNFIGDIVKRGTEAWVYLTEGTKEIRLYPKAHLPLTVNFADYGINVLSAKTTYVLTLTDGRQVRQTQKLIINYTPATAMVIVDSKVRRGNGHLELELPVGEHSYVIAEDGYDSAEGTVKLNASSPRTITESLVLAAVSPAPMENPQSVKQHTAPIVADTPKDVSVAASGSQADAIESFTVNGVSFNMVRVDGGTFTMGATAEQGNDAYDWEKPAHQVTLSTYSIGETEVTQALWKAVMGRNPSKFKGNNRPVENVSWDDCQIFVQILNQVTGRRFRLPTEAEWEYAARGGNRSRGYKYAGSDNLNSVAWYDDKSSYKTHDVGSKSPNELGLYDMSGNVLEWCQDWYGSYSSNSQMNPTGPSSGSSRVLRGGGWFNAARYCRSSYRGGYTPSDRNYILGLRLAL